MEDVLLPRGQWLHGLVPIAGCARNPTFHIVLVLVLSEQSERYSYSGPPYAFVEHEYEYEYENENASNSYRDSTISREASSCRGCPGKSIPFIRVTYD